jgi:hypothetical protein
MCAVLLALVGGASILTSCVGPARTSSDYKLKARASAKSALSAVSTAELAAKLVREKKTFSTYVTVVLDSAEGDVSSVESTFSSIQPPHQDLDDLRDRVNKTMSDATDAISSMRIAARRHAWDDLLDAARDLPRIARELQRESEIPA